MALKLNKQQIEALASKIYKKIADPIIEHNKKITSHEHLYPLIKKEFLQYKDVFKLIEKRIIVGFEIRINGSNYYINSPTIEEEIKIVLDENRFNNLRNYIIKLFKKKEISVTKNEIINDIILETIECDSLDQLIETITAKYSV
jgi:hypothetical protein